MRNYEVVVILDPSLDERTIEPSLDKYLGVIRNDGGSVESVDVWGRRRLAYEIKKNAEGIYVVINLTAEPATVKEFDRQLTLNESILRTKVLRPVTDSGCGEPLPDVSEPRMMATTALLDRHLGRPDMAGETNITVVGNLVDDPELRFTPSGAAVANFRIASTPRTFDRQTNEWKDGDTLFLSCSVWRQAAENVAESLQRGMRVIVQGRLKSRQYETREGEKRTVFEIDVEEVGPSLKSATAKVARASRQGGAGGGFGGGQQGGGFGGGQQGGGFGGGQQSAPADDPWATPGAPGRLAAAGVDPSPAAGWPGRCPGQRPVGRPRRRLGRAPVLTRVSSRVCPRLRPFRVEHPQPFRSRHSEIPFRP